MAGEKKLLDENGLALLWAKIKEEDAKKQDKESGKGLSSNDYTGTEKAKLANIEEGAQVNNLEAVQVNGVDVPINNKIANIPVPTNNNQMTNGANYTTMSAVEGKGYQTKTQVEAAITGKGYQTKADVQTLINASAHLTKKVVNSLPTTGQENIIYLVPKSSGETGNVYDEWQWINNKWEKMGDSKIDLSNYYNTSNLIPLTEAEIDAICV